MLVVTPAAREYLSERLPDDSQEVCFSLVPMQSGEFALRLKGAEVQDTKFRHEGGVILAVAPRVAHRLDGWLLDADPQAKRGAGLILMRAPDRAGDHL